MSKYVVRNCRNGVAIATVEDLNSAAIAEFEYYEKIAPFAPLNKDHSDVIHSDGRSLNTQENDEYSRIYLAICDGNFCEPSE